MELGIARYLLWNSYFKLFGWLLVPLLILLIFQYCSYQVTKIISSYSVLFQYLQNFIYFLPIIASRPCFERGLVIPGYIGVIISFIYLVIALVGFRNKKRAIGAFFIL